MKHDNDWKTMSDEQWCAEKHPSGVVAAWVGVIVLTLIVAVTLCGLLLSSYEWGIP